MRNLLMVLKSFFGINASTGSNAILPRFSMYTQRFRYFFLINRKWLEGKCVNGEFYSIDDNSHIKNTKHFIVVYRNGQMAFESRKFRFYPEEVIGLDSFEPEVLVLKKEEFEKGKFFCRISYSQSPIFPEKPQYYETTIQNISNQKIKITSFGAFVETDDILYKLNTVTVGHSPLMILLTGTWTAPKGGYIQVNLYLTP